MNQQYDTIVIGLGAMGSATLYQLAKLGSRVLGLDRYHPPHEFGSSHAETRITRLAIGEGAHYLPLVARSHEIWQELSEISGIQLLFQPGGYIIAPQNNRGSMAGHWDDFVHRTAVIAKQAAIPYQLRQPADVRAAHPHILIQDGDLAGFEPTGGVVCSEEAIKLQLTLAQQAGATVQTNEPVMHLDWSTDSVTVTTAHGTYTAAQAVVSAGPWMRDFLPTSLQSTFRVTRQVVYWFEVEDPALYSTDQFPFILWSGQTLEDYFAAFPIPPNGIPGIKILTEQYVDETNPTDVNRTVSAAEIDHFYHTLACKKLAGVTPNCIKTAVCLYTHTPDDHFVIDHHPKTERLLIVSACSSHGFKHSAAIGESVAQKVVHGHSKIDLSQFQFSRLANLEF